MKKQEILNKAIRASQSKVKYERERGEKALRYLSNMNDQGRWGRAAELLDALTYSRKVRVSKQGWDDIRIRYMNENGRIVYANTERKTNGGRIEELTEKDLQQKNIAFVVYSMDDVPVPQGKKAKAEGRPVEYRNVDAVVIPKDLFLEKLKEFNAVKPMYHNGVQDGWGIQVTSKKWYEWLAEYPVIWEQGYTYEAWMFEGLE